MQSSWNIVETRISIPGFHRIKETVHSQRDRHRDRQKEDRETERKDRETEEGTERDRGRDRGRDSEWFLTPFLMAYFFVGGGSVRASNHPSEAPLCEYLYE